MTLDPHLQDECSHLYLGKLSTQLCMYTLRQIRFNGCAVKRGTADFDWPFVHTPAAHVELCAVILSKCTGFYQ